MKTEVNEITVFTPTPLGTTAVFQDLYGYYEIHKAAFWTTEEVDMSMDRMHFQQQLTKSQRQLLSCALSFFANSDQLVNENINMNFIEQFKCNEVKFFYAFQTAMENEHILAYNTMINTVAKDETERMSIFNGTAKYECVQKKLQWIQKWISDEDKTLAERLVAFIAVEGIMFSASFAIIAYVTQGGLLPGVRTANEWISRDEKIHWEFAATLFCRLPGDMKIPVKRIVEIVESAVGVEETFIRESLSHVDNPDISANSLCQHVKFVADLTLARMRVEKHFNVQNPFDFMNSFGVVSKTNFFERRVTHYKISHRGFNQSLERLDELEANCAAGVGELKALSRMELEDF